MAENSKIEWTTHTFNPWRGCTRVSDGCKKCYADTLSKRNPLTLGVWGPNGTRVVAAESYWREPVKWNRLAGEGKLPDGSPNPDGHRPRVFCASLADVFEDWAGPVVDSRGSRLARGNEWHVSGGGFIPTDLKVGRDIVTMDDCRIRLFDLIRQTPHLDWLLLTKRPQNVLPTLRRCIDRVKELGYPVVVTPPHPNDQDMRVGAWMNGWLHGDSPQFGHTPPRNLWLGTSVENQAAADERIPHLLRTPTAVRFLICEPLLSAVDLGRWLPESCDCGFGPLRNDTTCPDCGERAGRQRAIGWVIVGGESGPGSRPMHPDWARSLRDQCQAAGVAFHFKQYGEWVPGDAGANLSPSRESVTIGNDGKTKHPDEPNLTAFRFVTLHRVGKHAAVRLLDGRTWDELPAVVTTP